MDDQAMVEGEGKAEAGKRNAPGGACGDSRARARARVRLMDATLGHGGPAPIARGCTHAPQPTPDPHDRRYIPDKLSVDSTPFSSLDSGLGPKAAHSAIRVEQREELSVCISHARRTRLSRRSPPVGL